MSEWILDLPIGVSGPLPIPDGKVGLAGIAVLAQRWSEILMVTDEKRSLEAGEPVSCRKGCAACCRELIPVSPAEAFHIREMSQTPDPERSEALLSRFEQARMTVAAYAEPRGLIQLEPDVYFRLHLACPFLEAESCSIHDSRPLACREHLALSPADHCSSFPSPIIRTLSLSHQVGEALERLCAYLLGGAPERIPLIAALEWAEAHAEFAERRWDGEVVARALASHLFSK